MVRRFMPGEAPGIVEADIQAPGEIESAGHQRPPFLAPDFASGIGPGCVNGCVTIFAKCRIARSIIFFSSKKMPGVQAELIRISRARNRCFHTAG